MNHHYKDIRSHIPEEPTWFDEYAVPRYCPFSPDEIADIYADECLLMEIRCQGCERAFLVAVSLKKFDRFNPATMSYGPSLADRVKAREVDYGDPPNVECCPAGPTMTSMSIRVVEFWTQDDRCEWARVPELEVEVAEEF